MSQEGSIWSYDCNAYIREAHVPSSCGSDDTACNKSLQESSPKSMQPKSYIYNMKTEQSKAYEDKSEQEAVSDIIAKSHCALKAAIFTLKAQLKDAEARSNANAALVSRLEQSVASLSSEVDKIWSALRSPAFAQGRDWEGHIVESLVAGNEHEVAIESLERLPKKWRPSAKLLPQLSSEPWTSIEQKDADEAVARGLDEMIAYQSEHPETILALGTDSVEAYLDTAYAADHMTALRDKALDMARKNLKVLAASYINAENACKPDVSTLLTLVTYAHSLSRRLPSDPDLMSLRHQLITRTNLSMTDCGSLKAVMDYDYVPLLCSERTPNSDDVFNMVIWSVRFIDALSIAELKLPPGTDVFIAELWAYLATYPVHDAVAFCKGVNNTQFYSLAYLMTHAGYIPTGYGRHALKVRTAPWLYRFLRANFYAVLEMGELDLSAEFIDLLRQYGCNELDDRQVRDGSRHLLALYMKSKRAWMNYRESYETTECNPYDLMHKPWTAIAGLRKRTFEPDTPGTYGDVANRLLGPALLAESRNYGIDESVGQKLQTKVKEP